ncbi:MAG: RagB/SusD family nutrient uptake outer membrane protein [Prevotella sp.]|nr:RagB/SusD family nutrient uptake outer membrane protein [Prevotella sp.]
MKTSHIILSALTILALASCNDFLSTEDLTRKDSSNFPKTQSDAEQSLTGCYAMLRYLTPDNESEHPMIVAEILSDDRFGGGGPDDAFLHNVDNLTAYNNDMFKEIWDDDYKGIHRCNQLIEQMGQINWASDQDKAQTDGEARFLRAYYYLSLARFFGNVPLITTSLSNNPPQASADEVYAQIASDLLTAINEMPSTPANELSSARLGHANRWAAEGLLARAYLFYTGYYQKESLTAADGTVLDNAKVAAYLKDCIDNSGYKLMPDFRNLWPYANKYSKADYKYASDNDLNWYGEGIDNLEFMFSIKYSSKANWDDNNAYVNNEACLFFSPRESDGSTANNFPLGIGWGAGTVSSKMLAEWKAYAPKDPRIDGSIFDVTKEAPNYSWGADKQQDETGLWEKKYCAINYKVSSDDGDTYQNISMALYPDVSSDYMINNVQDIVVLRFADILLMHSELTKTVDGINHVRARVGLPAISTYSDQVLQSERRFELAFEGERWFDLLRWHKAAAALAAENGVTVRNNNVEESKDMSNIAQRVEATGGFLQIPQSQIDLSNGVLKQNKGW